MALVPLQVPPGVSSNGTDLQNVGRWIDASLVRWHEGTVRPVSGWSARTASTTNAAPRGCIAWTDLSDATNIALGTYNKLYHLSVGGTLSDITPVGLTAGQEDATLNTGYGGGFYGAGFYGTPRLTSSSYVPATTWALDNWGENLIACSDSDGKIYEWSLVTTVLPTAVTNAPTNNATAFVTEERFLVALGAGGDPRKVQWSDKEDNTVWTAAATNEAGDFNLQTNGSIRQGMRVRGQSLILTDVDAHTMNYIGPQLVYGFQRVGSACGTISRKAATVSNGVAYWMGPNGFFRYAGGGVEEIPCSVTDYVFSNVTGSQVSKIWAVPNTKFNEIWWFYPQGSECDHYVVYNYAENHWSVGVLGRTAGTDGGVVTVPVYAAADGAIYDHETGNNYDGAEVFAEALNFTGDTVSAVTHLIPDEDTQGDVTVTFKTRYYPNDTEYTHGPYTMASPTSVRFSGRQIRSRITGNALASWRWGIPRIDMKQMGGR